MSDAPVRSLLLELAARGHRAPIGTHLELHRQPEAEAAARDGRRLGEVIVAAAARFRTPLAVPLMDLTIEKEALLAALGVPAPEIEAFHFGELPGDAPFAPSPRMEAACAAIAHVAARAGDLLPMGMGIGPFSLMTKLVADPIAPVFLAAGGAGPDDEPEVAVVERVLALGVEWVLAYLAAQADAGARAFILCEPAANQVYFSPRQLEREGYGVFERYVLAPLRRIKALADARGVALVFHDCGELTEGMVRRFAAVDPAMISLGSSRLLWEDAALVGHRTVLYGNLPTKRFISPALTVAEVARLGAELRERMRATGHPFILGSECDVLSVPGREEEILAKVEAFLAA